MSIVVSKEEYKELQWVLDKGYEWLARDKSGTLFAFISEPYKGISDNLWDTQHWDNREMLGLPYYEIFLFIKWEDESPYNIRELIMVYEKSVTINPFEEGKYLDWLLVNVHKELESWRGVEGGIDGNGINEVLNLITYYGEQQKLKEGEVILSVGHDGGVETHNATTIEEAMEILTDYGTDYLLVDKPVLPQYVADFLESARRSGIEDLLELFERTPTEVSLWWRNATETETIERIEAIAVAWITDRYDIERYKKYRIKAGDNYVYFNLDGTVRGVTKSNAAITEERLRKLPFDVDLAVSSGIIELEEL